MAYPEETEKYFNRLTHLNISDHSIRVLEKTEFRIRSIGFGGYRVHYNSIEHARALRYALLNGINLIDTSSNYTDGGSEMLIGNLLQEMMEREEVHREEIVVVSKVGYVQGQNLKLAMENEALGTAFPEMVKFQENCWHCIHPDFLQDQLSRSLERLHLPSLDVYLLHNPEYFLVHCKQSADWDLDSARQEYYRRIQTAFEWMEEKVSEGKIKSYGISSNTFPHPAADFEFTSLEKVLAIAEYVASHHYFQVIQFPFNPFEAGAVFEKNQADGQKTLLQLVGEKKLAALTNRPLNAVTQEGMMRLASFRETDARQLKTAFAQKKKALSHLETQFQSQILSKLPDDIPKQSFTRPFTLSKQLQNALKDFEHWENWDHIKQNIILPQTWTYLNYLNNKMPEDAAWQKWSEAYANTLYDFLDTISRHYENIAQARSRQIAEKLDRENSLLQSSETLSQKTLQLLTSVSGVQCVLLGMRKMPYVEDALAALQKPQIANAEEILEKLKENSSPGYPS
ncbi:MAG: aldo/keto reductase [bacterium]